jgi:hypothetical protein
LLLITLVVALVLSHVARTVYERNPGLSPFYQQFDPGLWSNGRPVAGGLSGSNLLQRQQAYGVKRFLLNYPLAAGAATRELFVAEVRNRLEQELPQAECEINSRTNVGDPLTGFTLDYGWHGNTGSLDVQSFPLPNGEYGLFVTLHEVRVKW